MPICVSTFVKKYIVLCMLKARIGGPAVTGVREQPCKHYMTFAMVREAMEQ
jgi:hypothetical protein